MKNKEEQTVANKTLFQTIAGKLLPKADSRNEENAIAYELTPKQKLAQYAATGCLNATFYAGAEMQLKTVLDICETVEPGFIAKTAVYARKTGHMKDMPALLTAVLSTRDIDLLAKAFPRICDNGRMVRNFVQIMRSGAVGRKSLGSRPKRLVRHWLDTRTEDELFRESVGNAPSVADIIKMVHPVPGERSREALYGYLIGKKFDSSALPGLAARYERYKAGDRGEVPNVPFQMLTSLVLGKREWTTIARNATWHMTRMNLNTFARHGVFEEPGMAGIIAERLRDPEAIRKSRVFPYQIMAAYFSTGDTVPAQVRSALQDAMELAIENVPSVEGKVYVFPDVSGSMESPVTGYRRGSSSAIRCIDVAALMTAAILRKNPEAEVLPFEHSVVRVNINPRDSVMTNAEKLAAVGGGGTNCSAPLAKLNKKKARGDLVVFVSDNESWVDNRHYGATAVMREWSKFRKRNPGARMACIDIQPYGTVQAKEREDILNIGGFSDNIFTVMSRFADGTLGPDHWVGEIEKITLD